MAVKFKQAVDRVPAAKAKVFKRAAASTFRAPSTTPLAGYWLNCDAKTRGVEAIRIGGRKKLSVEAWGSCSPKWCVWGSAKPAHAYAPSVSSGKAVAFTAIWDFGFADKIMTAHFCGGCLSVAVFTRFKDGSKRYDYYMRDCFYRADLATWKRKTKGNI